MKFLTWRLNNESDVGVELYRNDQGGLLERRLNIIERHIPPQNSQDCKDSLRLFLLRANSNSDRTAWLENGGFIIVKDFTIQI